MHDGIEVLQRKSQRCFVHQDAMVGCSNIEGALISGLVISSFENRRSRHGSMEADCLGLATAGIQQTRQVPKYNHDIYNHSGEEGKAERERREELRLTPLISPTSDLHTSKLAEHEDPHKL